MGEYKIKLSNSEESTIVDKDIYELLQYTIGTSLVSRNIFF